MKVLLANPPWESKEGHLRGIRAGSRWPHLRSKRESLDYYPFPFFLAYAAAMLRAAGHTVHLRDYIADGTPEDKFLEDVREFSPELAVLETSTPSIEHDLRHSANLKADPGCLVALCGQHATALPEEVLNSGRCDFALLGEYEGALVKLAEALARGGNPAAVAGVACLEHGIFRNNGRAPLLPELDTLPLPDRDSLPMEKYNDPFCKHAPNAQMLTSRGCPYGCSFCVEPWIWYGKSNYRVRSPRSVVDEMELLVEQYGAREVYFDDSSFSVNQQRVLEICREIRQRGLKVYWSAMSDAKIEDATLREMKDSGCVAVKFGVESASPQILDNIGKHVNLRDVAETVQACRKLGIESHATFAFGLPGETEETLRQTIEYAFSLGCDTAQFAVAIPYPGTKFFKQAQANGWLTTLDWSNYDGQHACVVSYDQLPGDKIVQAVRQCRRRIAIRTALNPRQAMQYLSMIYRYAGPLGFIREIYGKLRYAVGGS